MPSLASLTINLTNFIKPTLISLTSSFGNCNIQIIQAAAEIQFRAPNTRIRTTTTGLELEFTELFQGCGNPVPRIKKEAFLRENNILLEDGSSRLSREVLSEVE